MDGTKIHANASRHSALSYGHAKKLERQLKREGQPLLKLAEQADAAAIPDGMSIPEELERREARRAAIAEARRKIEARVKEQDEANYQAKLASRAEQARRSGRQPRGRPPAPPRGGVKDKEQIDLPDEDSRIMKVAGGGFDQCYNAQAAVATGSLLVVANDVTEAANDKEQWVAMIGKLKALPKEGGAGQAGAGRQRVPEPNPRGTRCGLEDSAADRAGARAPPSAPSRTLCRGAQNPAARLGQRDAPDGVPTEDARGRKLYALRSQTPQPLFGIINSVMGFRPFLLRGLDNVKGEWDLVTMSWNTRRMFALSPG